MTFCGDYEDIYAVLKDLQRFIPRPSISCRFDLFLESSDGELILADSNTFQPIDTLKQPLNNCFLIEKSVLEKIMIALGNSKPFNNPINKTGNDFTKTGPLINITDPISLNGKSIGKCPTIATHVLDECPGTVLDSDLYFIEDHAVQCAAANRPTVFAIKQMSSNYFLLFYRKSVYDTGVDNNFRKYLSMQPGTLVAYRYCHSVNSIRSEFANLNLSLRHNGKNELSRYQADHILQTFNSMRFM